MRTTFRKFINKLYNIEIKQISLIRKMLSVLMLIYLVYSFTSENVNHIYKGIFYLSLATLLLLNSLEHKILKKKETNNFDAWILSGIMFLFIGVMELLDI